MPSNETFSDEWEKKGTTFIPFDNSEEDREERNYVDGPLARSQFDLPDGPLLRFQAYRAAWDKCLGRIKDIVHTLQDPVVDAVIHTVQNAYMDSLDEDVVVLPSSEFLTILVSSSDRMHLHEGLARIAWALGEEDDVGSRDAAREQRNSRAFISRLSESDCQTVMTLMKALIGGFISQPPGNKPPKKLKPSLSLVSYDIYLLKSWYQAVQIHYENNRPELVVLMQDLHTVDPIILRHLFEICSLHVPELPLIFIVGTSDPNHLHSVLPRSTLACMRLERYILPLGIKTLERVIRETFFSPNFTPDVMLGPLGFELVFSEFKRHNPTLDTVLSTLQLLHMQHFYNPLSFMVDASYDTALSDVLHSPSEEWKSFFRLLRQHSVFLFAREETDEPEWSELTPQKTIQNVVGARSTFRARMGRMKVATHVLETVLKFLRGHGQKASDIPFEKMGLEALRGTLGLNEVRVVCNLVRQLGREKTAALSEELFYFLQNLPGSARGSASKLKEKVVVIKNGADEETDVPFVDVLASYFKETLIPFEDIDCLDVWWTGETSIPHSPLNPNPHVAIVTTLLEPQEYLGWTKPTKMEPRRDLSSLPDTCILFRRYVESGKMINVYDWYDSFAVALEGEAAAEDDDCMDVDDTPSKRKGDKATSKGKRTENEEERNREVQARFMRAMHELEFVGFLKHTGRKAEHVVKTVFDVLD